MYSKRLLKFFLLFIHIFLFSFSVFSNKVNEYSSSIENAAACQYLDNDTLSREMDQFIEIDNALDHDTILVEKNNEAEEKKATGVVLDSKVKYRARDTIRFEINNQMVFLYGDAEIDYEDIHLQAEYIEIDFKKNEIYATGLPDTAGVMRGLPIFTEKGQSYQAKEIRYNFETEKGRTVDVVTEEADGFLHGSAVKLMDDETIHVGGGKYTTCDKPDPHFHIGFQKAKVMEERIVTGPANFYLMGIPLPIAIPFGFFPNTTSQASGILIPSYGESSNRGFYLKDGGFYWGISDYVDLSLKGDIYSRGSWALKTESRYNLRYRYSGNFNINYAINIDGEEGLPDYSRQRDFRVRWNHSQDPRARPNSMFRANVNAGSSQYNRYDPETTQDYLSNTFQSNIAYSATWGDGRYNFSTNLRHSQNTITEQIDMNLPELAFSVSRFFPFRGDGGGVGTRWYEDISISYDMNARNQIKTTDSLFLKSETWRNMNSGLRHNIPISHNFNLLNHFNVSSSVNYTERWYFQTIEREWVGDEFEISSPNGSEYGEVVTDTIPCFRAAREFNVRTGISTNIYGMRGFRRGPVSAVRHVIRPIVNFSYRPDFSDPFWGYYEEYSHPGYDEPVSYSVFEGGIYGVPPSGRSGAINFAIANNLEIKVRSREDGSERKVTLIDNFNISGSYDLARDSLNFSDIRLSGRTRLFDDFDISFSSTWTPYAVDENNNRIDKFLWDKEQRLLSLTNTNWNLSFSYNLSGGEGGRGGNAGNGSMEGGQQGGESPDEQGYTGNGFDETDQRTDAVEGAIDYSVPWNLRLSYNLNYTSRIDQRTYDAQRDYNQTLSMNGNIRLTSKWRIGVSTGYDFKNNDITYTSIDIYRDLHCWEMMINWVPFGFRRSYNLTIRVKSPVLQDLKYEQRREFFDF